MSFDSIESVPESVYLETLLNEVDDWDEEDICDDCGEYVSECSCDDEDDIESDE